MHRAAGLCLIFCWDPTPSRMTLAALQQSLDMTVSPISWPDGGKLTAEWVHHLATSLENNTRSGETPRSLSKCVIRPPSPISFTTPLSSQRPHFGFWFFFTVLLILLFGPDVLLFLLLLLLLPITHSPTTLPRTSQSDSVTDARAGCCRNSSRRSSSKRASTYSQKNRRS